MATVAKLNVQIGAELSGLQKSLKSAQASLESFGKQASAIGATFSTYITAPIVGGLGLAIKSASDAEETFSKFATIFRDVSKEAEDAFQTLRKEYGLSAKASKQLLGDTGDLLTGFGFAQDEALRLSTEVQKLAVDLASFTNFSGGAEGASAALTKALLGERESVKALGIAILEEDVQKQMAINTAKGLTFATERQAKAQATLDLAMRQSQNAIGDYARTSDSFANQVRQLQTDISDLTVELGQKLLPVARQLLNTFRDLVTRFQAFDDATKQTIINFTIMFAAIGPVLVVLGSLSTALANVAKLAKVVLSNPFTLVYAGAVALLGIMVKLALEYRKTKSLIEDTPISGDMPINDQVQISIQRLRDLDNQLAKLQDRQDKLSGTNIINANDVQIMQLRERIVQERELLTGLIARQKAETNLSESVQTTASQSEANTNLAKTYKAINELLDENNARIEQIVNTTGQLTTVQIDELAKLTQLNRQLESQVELRRTIARLQSQGISTQAGRVSQLPDTGGLQQRRVDADAYASSLQALGSKINQIKVETVDLTQVNQNTSGSFEFLSGIAETFTSSFGAGLANVIVQGEKLQDVLKNIGKLLLSAAIQKGISLLLTGGLTSAGTGFFGSGGGLFGKLLGKQAVNDALITSSGKVIEFSPKDNILAMQDFGALGGSGGKKESPQVDKLIELTRKVLYAVMPLNSTMGKVNSSVQSASGPQVNVQPATVNVNPTPVTVTPPPPVVVNPTPVTVTPPPITVNPPVIELPPPVFNIPGLENFGMIPDILVNFVDTLANFGNTIPMAQYVQPQPMIVQVEGTLTGSGTELYAVIKNVERSYR